jgi:hypothetical protein
LGPTASVRQRDRSPSRSPIRDGAAAARRLPISRQTDSALGALDARSASVLGGQLVDRTPAKRGDIWDRTDSRAMPRLVRFTGRRLAQQFDRRLLASRRSRVRVPSAASKNVLQLRRFRAFPSSRAPQQRSTRHPLPEIIDAVRRLRTGETLLAMDEVVGLLEYARRRRDQQHDDRKAIESLTFGERQVLQALADGLDTQAAARRLDISRAPASRTSSRSSESTPSCRPSSSPFATAPSTCAEERRLARAR